MDNAIFIGGSGSKTSMHQLEVLTNNLANVNTVGFRADLESTKQSKNDSSVQRTRVYASVDNTYVDFTHGPTIRTDNDLDIAISGEGFIAVQTKEGKEGYTRAGELIRTADGSITTKKGDLVLGTAGPLTTPQNTRRITISEDGTVAVLLQGQDLPVTVNRLKLTNPDVSELRKGEDGLLYTMDESAVPLDEKVRITPGAVEGSNVSPVKALTDLIEISRQFEMNNTVMKKLEAQATKSNQVLEMPR